MTPDELLQDFNIPARSWGALMFRRACYMLGMDKRKRACYEDVIGDLADIEGCAVWEVETAINQALHPILTAYDSTLRAWDVLLVERTAKELCHFLAFEIATGFSTNELYKLQISVNGHIDAGAVDSFGKSTGMRAKAGQGPAGSARAERPQKSGERGPRV